jgi:hypothetical protein
VEITIRRGPNAESLNQLQARIPSGSLRGGQEASVDRCQGPGSLQS